MIHMLFPTVITIYLWCDFFLYAFGVSLGWHIAKWIVSKFP